MVETFLKIFVFIMDSCQILDFIKGDSRVWELFVFSMLVNNSDDYSARMCV